MAHLPSQPALGTETPVDDDRRKFLATCGQFAVVTPPALTVLLSTSLSSEAIAHSGGGVDRDHGNRHHDWDRRGWGGRGDRDHDRNHDRDDRRHDRD
jgi:hypothetical protein